MLGAQPVASATSSWLPVRGISWYPASAGLDGRSLAIGAAGARGSRGAGQAAHLYDGDVDGVRTRLDAPEPSRVPGWLARFFVGEATAEMLTSPMPTSDMYEWAGD